LEPNGYIESAIQKVKMAGEYSLSELVALAA